MASDTGQPSIVKRIPLGDGATELALNTAEPASHLIDYYTKRGYRIVERTDATQPHYRSVIMSKTLLAQRQDHLLPV